MQCAHLCHEISDRVWEPLKPYLPGRECIRGVLPVTIDAFLMLFSGYFAQERHEEDLPPDYGDWKNTHRRFCRWRDAEVWEQLLEILISEPDFEWLIIDASHIKVHPHATGANGDNQDIGCTKGGSTQRYTWRGMRMVCRSELLSQKLAQ